MDIAIAIIDKPIDIPQSHKFCLSLLSVNSSSNRVTKQFTPFCTANCIKLTLFASAVSNCGKNLILSALQAYSSSPSSLNFATIVSCSYTTFPTDIVRDNSNNCFLYCLISLFFIRAYNFISPFINFGNKVLRMAVRV